MPTITNEPLHKDAAVAVRTEPAEMSSEPVRTLGDIVASKKMIKTYVAAIIAIVATVFKFTVDDAFVENVTTVVQLVSIIATGGLAKMEQSDLAHEQADVTREYVYAPSTVKRLVTEAARTGDASIPDPPADEVSVKGQRTGKGQD